MIPGFARTRCSICSRMASYSHRLSRRNFLLVVHWALIGHPRHGLSSNSNETSFACARGFETETLIALLEDSDNSLHLVHTQTSLFRITPGRCSSILSVSTHRPSFPPLCIALAPLHCSNPCRR